VDRLRTPSGQAAFTARSFSRDWRALGLGFAHRANAQSAVNFIAETVDQSSAMLITVQDRSLARRANVARRICDYRSFQSWSATICRRRSHAFGADRRVGAFAFDGALQRRAHQFAKPSNSSK
jgi:hypothetical protein